MQNYLFSLTFDGELALAPVSNPKMVLDIGTGTGIWAIEYAVQNPSATVTGSDLSAIQPTYTPPNCRFEVEDAEDTWNYTQPFDYIHGRAMFSCFKSPLAVFKNAYSALEPGGWFEMQEVHFKPHSLDGTVEGTALQTWNEKLVEGARLLGGKDWHCAPHYSEWFQEAGFVDVVERQFSWPSNTWPKGKKQKLMGMTMLANALEGLNGVSMAVLSRAFGWSAKEVEEYLVDVRRDMEDSKFPNIFHIIGNTNFDKESIHAYFPVFVVYGRKPI
jgi:hypothetical protein